MHTPARRTQSFLFVDPTNPIPANLILKSVACIVCGDNPPILHEQVCGDCKPRFNHDDILTVPAGGAHRV